MIDHWMDAISRRREVTEIFVVTAGRKYKHFERWATSHGLPVRNVVNNGTTTAQGRLGAARDLLLGLTRAAGFDEDTLVLGGEALFFRPGPRRRRRRRWTRWPC